MWLLEIGVYFFLKIQFLIFGNFSLLNCNILTIMLTTYFNIISCFRRLFFSLKSFDFLDEINVIAALPHSQPNRSSLRFDFIDSSIYLYTYEEKSALFLSIINKLVWLWYFDVRFHIHAKSNKLSEHLSLTS